MANLIDVIHYNLHKISAQIVALKVEAIKNPLAVQQRVIWHAVGATLSGIKVKTRSVMTKHLSPGHPDRGLYMSLKRQASLWFMVLQFAKHPGESTVNNQPFTKKLLNHGTSDMIPIADRMLTALLKRLDNHRQYEGLDAWLTERTRAINEYRRSMVVGVGDLATA